MKTRRILSGLLIILGIGMYFVGNHIADEVADGRKKLASAQNKVDHGRRISRLRPLARHRADDLTDSAQGKIDEKREEADNYQVLASWLHGGGITLLVVGAGLLAFSFGRKKQR